MPDEDTVEKNLDVLFNTKWLWQGPYILPHNNITAVDSITYEILKNDPYYTPVSTVPGEQAEGIGDS